MTSTHSLVKGGQPEHASAPGLLSSQSEPGSTNAPSTAPDVAYEKESSQSTTDDHDEREEKPKPDDAKFNEHPSGARLVCIVLALVLAIFLVSLDLTIVATVIPKITDEFHGLADLSWYSAAFFMTSGGFQSAWGKVYKYFPLKISLAIPIFIFELGSLICGVAYNSTALIMGRAIAGLGAAGIGSGTYTIIAFSASLREKILQMNLVGVVLVMGAVISYILALHYGG